MSLVGFQAQNHPQQTAARRTGNDRRWNATDEADDRATVPETFDPLHERYRFTVDVAAAAHNAKLPRFYDRQTNGLIRPWSCERVWCNPPYSDLRPWVAKAWTEWSMLVPPELIVMLLPANRTEQGWWQDLVEPELRAHRPDFRVEFLRGRLRFLKPGETTVPPNSRPPFGCCLLIWGTP